MYKNLLVTDSPVQRECVKQILSKLCDADKVQKGLVKEVSVMPANESMPDDSRKVIVPDESMTEKDVDRFRTKFNKGCKAIRYPGMILLATNRGRHVVTKHRLDRRKLSQNLRGVLWEV